MATNHITASEANLKSLLRSARYRPITDSEELDAHEAIDTIKRVAGHPLIQGELLASLEHFKKWQREWLRDRMSNYEDAPDANILADDIDHAIDHIITDHCPDLEEK